MIDKNLRELLELNTSDTDYYTKLKVLIDAGLTKVSGTVELNYIESSIIAAGGRKDWRF